MRAAERCGWAMVTCASTLSRLDLGVEGLLLLDLGGGRFRDGDPREHERSQQDLVGVFFRRGHRGPLFGAAAGRGGHVPWRNVSRLVQQYPPLRPWVRRIHEPFRTEGRFRQLDSVVYLSVRRVSAAIRLGPETGVRMGIGRFDALLDATGKIRDQLSCCRLHGFGVQI